MRKLRERREDRQGIPEIEPRSPRLLYFPISRLVHALTSTRHHRTDGYYLRFHVRCLMSTFSSSFITFRHISRTECLAPFTASGGANTINVITLASPSSYSQLPSFQRGFEASRLRRLIRPYGVTGSRACRASSPTGPSLHILIFLHFACHVNLPRVAQSCIYVPSQNPE